MIESIEERIFPSSSRLFRNSSFDENSILAFSALSLISYCVFFKRSSSRIFSEEKNSEKFSQESLEFHKFFLEKSGTDIFGKLFLTKSLSRGLSSKNARIFT